MSVQDATAFLDKIESDAALKARIQSRADAVRIGSDMGLTFTEAELGDVIDDRYGELSAEELAKVAGGFKAL